MTSVNIRFRKFFRLLFIVVVALIGVLLASISLGPRLGFVWLANYPTDAMAPTINANDKLLISGLGLDRIQRGDIIAFKTDNIPGLDNGSFFLKRVAALPGEQIQITNADYFINGSKIILSNTFGPLTNHSPKGSSVPAVDQKVPPDHFFVIGDNSANSYDSRFWGPVPRGNIVGRVLYRYAPSKQAGRIR